MNIEYINAVKLNAKMVRLSNMKGSFKFRLAAMIAADNRAGKVWP